MYNNNENYCIYFVIKYFNVDINAKLNGYNKHAITYNKFPLNNIVDNVYINDNNKFMLFPGYINKCYKTNIYPAVN